MDPYPLLCLHKFELVENRSVSPAPNSSESRPTMPFTQLRKWFLNSAILSILASFDRGKSTSELFTEEQHVSFQRDGFIVASGLLDVDELEYLVEAGDAYMATSKKRKSYFSSVEMGMMFEAGNSANHTITQAFRRVALNSALPRAAAELMHIYPTSSKIRVLRDVFMSKAVEEDSTCDWHVDDVGFWPESYISEQEGVNVWIAMHDMPASFQGSMALSPGSHKADWRFEAYEAIGQNRTYHGGFTREEMKQRAEAGEKLLSTCEIKDRAPEIREQIESTAFVPDIKKGDVIFATRSLFHRTLAVTEEGKEFYASHGIEYLNRYSIRYVPGSARLPQGWTFEWSIANNEANAGKSLDCAMEQQDNLLWYPEVWPKKDEARDEKLDNIAASSLEEAKSITRSELFELISLFTVQQ